MKLAEALLRRKELQQKVDQLRAIKQGDVFEVKMQRRSISDSVDDITAQVPKLQVNQVTHEFDYYANKLRLIDGAIQNLNWTTEIEVEGLVWKDYSDAHPKTLQSSD